MQSSIHADTQQWQMRHCCWRRQPQEILRVRPGLISGATAFRFHSTKKPRDRHVQQLAQSEQASSADAILTDLIFLHLLETDANALGQNLLGDAKKNASLSKAHAYMNINPIGFASVLRGYFLTLSPAALARDVTVPSRLVRDLGT
jgi:hypothetical protein